MNGANGAKLPAGNIESWPNNHGGGAAPMKARPIRSAHMERYDLS